MSNCPNNNGKVRWSLMPDERLKENFPLTYEDILSRPENERWELIDGIPFMQARPTDTHQRIMRELVTQFHSFLRGKSCEVFTEFPVWFENRPGDFESGQYFIPDLVINCDNSRVTKDGIQGSPEMIIEILSPTTAGVDKIKKFRKYQNSGVKEYWIVEPDQRLITVFKLGPNKKYSIIETYDEGEILVEPLSGLTIALGLVFSKEESETENHT
jgi:Uma2 family endonuclease